MKYSASTRLPIRRPCMSVKATTTVSTSPRSTSEASASCVSGALRVRGSVSTPSFLSARAGDEPLGKVARPRQGGGELFRVALDRHDQAVVRLDALDSSVLTLLLSVERRVDVPAARQEQAVDLLWQGRRAGQQVDRLSPGGLDRAPVRRVVLRSLALARRDRYPRSVVAQALPVSSCCRRP